MTDPTPDPRITKRRVTMTSSVIVGRNEDGEILYQTQQATDYVRPDILDAYLADARTKWQMVEVSEEPDAGPLGFDGPTIVPEHLDHPAAGTYYPATKDSEAETQLLAAGDTLATAAAQAGATSAIQIGDLLAVPDTTEEV